MDNLQELKEKYKSIENKLVIAEEDKKRALKELAKYKIKTVESAEKRLIKIESMIDKLREKRQEKIEQAEEMLGQYES
jgi:hypothetical protein